MQKTGSMIYFPPVGVLVLSFSLIILGLSGCKSQVGEGSELREASALSEEETFSDGQGTGTSAEQEKIYVHVCGEVRTPGVYELPAGSRVYEAVEAAGGMTEAAAAVCLNQAEKVNDGQQIYVPSAEGPGEGEESAGGAADDGKVSLNTASKEELMTLPGIGEVKAEAILRYREEKGGFTSVEQLKDIEGIKDGVFNKVKDQLKI